MLLIVWVLVAAVWLAAMPKDFRGKKWHYAHLLLITAALLTWRLAPPELAGFARLFMECGALVALMGVVVWAVGERIRNHSIMDVAYPVMILVVAGYALLRGPAGVTPHSGLLFALVFVWCARLVSHASSTNMKVEQEPYANLRRRYGARWPLWSLFAVYALQGAILWIWCAAIIMAMSVGDGGLSVLDLIGLAVWGVGFFFQAVGDWQLKQFKRDPANRGKLMQSGLWSLTRHPNYFGESLMWFGYFFFALQHPWGWLTLVSPIYVTWFMGYGSAAPGNERHMRKTRPEYDEYAKRVPRLFPRLWPARAA